MSILDWFPDRKRQQQLKNDVKKAELELKLNYAMVSGDVCQKIIDQMATQKLIEIMKEDKELFLRGLEECGVEETDILENINLLNSHLYISQIINLIKEQPNIKQEFKHIDNGVTFEYVPDRWENENYIPEHVKVNKTMADPFSFESIYKAVLKQHGLT